MRNDTFGQRFKALRTQRHLTQEKIAEIFYLNTSSISKYEKDKSTPETALLIQFADFFGVSLDYLLCRTEASLYAGPSPADLFIGADQSLRPLSEAQAAAVGAFLSLPDETQKEITDFIDFKAGQAAQK